MLETVHDICSRIRHSPLLERQQWLWKGAEPYWQRFFELYSRQHGFQSRINGDTFRLEYTLAARLDQRDPSVTDSLRPYEPFFYRAFVEMLSEGMTVFDIGAHIGIFTLAAAKRVGRGGHVYAFEPSPETARLLRRHIAFNGWQDRVRTVSAVVSDVNGTVPFYVHGISMSASLSRQNVELVSPERRDTPATLVHVPSVTLDQFCAKRNIWPDVVKIDAEGAELHVLRGAKELLLNKRITILCEIHPTEMQNCGSSLRDFEAYLESVGYTSQPVDEPSKLGIWHGLITRRAA